MNTKPAVILLCGQPHVGRKYVMDYLFRARQGIGATIECVSFRQATIQSAVATLADAKDILIEGVNVKSVATFPLSQNVREFLELVNQTVRKNSPSLLAHWVMMWIRIRHQNGCRLFVVPDLDYLGDVDVLQRFDKEFNFRFVHVVAVNRTIVYNREHPPTALEALPENVEATKKEEEEIPKLDPGHMRKDYVGLFHMMDNSADGTEHVKNFQRAIFFDLGLRVDPEFPWALFVAMVGSLIGIYFYFYH